MPENLNETLASLIDVVLEKIEKPLSQKKPSVKMALAEIHRIRFICDKLKKEAVLPVRYEGVTERHAPKYTYNCLYQCGFTTTSIREIDNHLTSIHNHPDPKRDYNHPIYNEP